MTDFGEAAVQELIGQIAVEALRRMAPAPDNAKGFHDAAERSLLEAGFDVRREVCVRVRESGRGLGFIDLLATKQGSDVAIELDNRTPRARSFDKLRAFDAYRIVALRGSVPWTEERGIDAIIAIPVGTQ